MEVSTATLVTSGQIHCWRTLLQESPEAQPGRSTPRPAILHWCTADCHLRCHLSTTSWTQTSLEAQRSLSRTEECRRVNISQTEHPIHLAGGVVVICRSACEHRRQGTDAICGVAGSSAVRPPLTEHWQYRRTAIQRGRFEQQRVQSWYDDDDGTRQSIRRFGRRSRGHRHSKQSDHNRNDHRTAMTIR